MTSSNQKPALPLMQLVGRADRKAPGTALAVITYVHHISLRLNFPHGEVVVLHAYVVCEHPELLPNVHYLMTQCSGIDRARAVAKLGGFTFVENGVSESNN